MRARVRVRARAQARTHVAVGARSCVPTAHSPRALGPTQRYRLCAGSAPRRGAPQSRVPGTWLPLQGLRKDLRVSGWFLVALAHVPGSCIPAAHGAALGAVLALPEAPSAQPCTTSRGAGVRGGMARAWDEAGSRIIPTPEPSLWGCVVLVWELWEDGQQPTMPWQRWKSCSLLGKELAPAVAGSALPCCLHPMGEVSGSRPAGGHVPHCPEAREEMEPWPYPCHPLPRWGGLPTLQLSHL